MDVCSNDKTDGSTIEIFCAKRSPSNKIPRASAEHKLRKGEHSCPNLGPQGKAAHVTYETIEVSDKLM